MNPINPQDSEGQKDRAANAAATAQADAIARATATNTPAGQPSDLANIHAALTPLPEYQSTTDDGSQAMPPEPWAPGKPFALLGVR